MEGTLDIKEVRGAYSVIPVGFMNQVTWEGLLNLAVVKWLCDCQPLGCDAFVFYEGRGDERVRQRFVNGCHVV